MAARYVLAALSLLFLGLAVLGGPGRALRARAWLIAGLLFGAMSTWLFIRG